MRSRNIKPGFFKNEVLGACDPLAQLLFSGLWMIADRDGRLEDRPMRIKGEIFPYRDGIVIDDILTELSRLKFITRYEAGGNKYIQIENFKKHQTPHKTEKLSEIPSKPLENNSSNASAVNAEKITAPLPSDSLIPDSLIPEGAAVAASDPLESPQVDFKKILFTEGLKMLGGEKARSLVGKWISDYGEQAVCSAFLSAQKQSAVEPKSYMIKILSEGKNATNIKHSAYGNQPSKSERARIAILESATELGYAAQQPGG